MAEDSASSTTVVTLRIGSRVGQGASGSVYPIVAARDSSQDARVAEIRVERPGYAERSAEVVGATTGSYVVKEIDATPSEPIEDAVRNEVALHQLCSQGCSGVVRFMLSGFTGGSDDSRYCVVMEACKCELWDVITAFRDVSKPATPVYQRTHSSLSSGSRSKPGQARRSLRPSVSSASLGQSQQHSLPSEAERWQWTSQLCDALQHCHSLGVAHRDINPWNVLVAANDALPGVCLSPRVVRLADFGLAVKLKRGPEGHLLDLSGVTSEEGAALDESALGSLYSAPELGGDRYGLPADVFSLGMTLLALWCAPDVQHLGAGAQDALISAVESAKGAASERRPVPDDALASMKASPGTELLRALILKMLAGEASQRPTMVEIVSALQRMQPLPDAQREDAGGDPSTPVRKCCCFWRTGAGKTKPERTVTVKE